MGKIFPHVVGVTASNASARGALAPMEICEANLGSRPKAGVLPGVVLAGFSTGRLKAEPQRVWEKNFPKRLREPYNGFPRRWGLSFLRRQESMILNIEL